MKSKYAVVLVVALGMALAGCASSSKAAQSDASAQKVEGEPPNGAADAPHALPKGPAVEVGKAHVDQEASETQGDTAGGPDAADAAVISRAQLDAFIKKGPSFALTQVKVEPARTDGKFQGFEIVDMKEGARKALAPQVVKGDVITHINGVRVKKPADYLNAWKLLEDISKIRIDFVRDGQAKHATWRVQ